MTPKKTPNLFPTIPHGERGERKPPQGLFFIHRPDRNLPFVARWREADGTLRSQAFETEKERWAFGELWGKERGNWGKASPIISPAQSAKWNAFDEMTGGADPIEVARFWLKYRPKRGGQMTVNTAVEDFLKIASGQTRSRDTESHLKLHLRRLTAVLGEKKMGDTTAEALRSWLSGLTDPETGAPLEPYTVRHHLRTLKFFFATAAREGWIDSNPAESIMPQKVESAEIEVLTLADAVKLFSANRDSLCVGRLALEAFGGLRFTSAARLTRDEILDADKGIVMPGAKHKSGRRHYVDGYPENLWAWIAHAPAACWQIHPRQYLDLKADAFTRAGVKNPGNVLRHSFCTYHVAQHKDAARTAVLLTHRSPTTLYQHYKGRASEADGKAYFAITP